MMKHIFPALLLIACLLAGCGAQQPRAYQYTDYTLFDTVTTVLGYASSPQEFDAQAKEICRELQRYHRLFDIYEEYDGIKNLKTVNDQAGIAPVKVEKPILDLLEDCRNYTILTDNRVNPALGPVLQLWHAAREASLEHPDQPVLPDPSELIRASQFCDMGQVILNREQGTVYLPDPHMRLDVGAVAKGWAAQRVCRNAPEGYLISVGGNVCVTGPKPGGEPWIVGIQNPEGTGYLHQVELTKGSAVTSGDYQRYFTVEGKTYHHIIDPDTLQPARYWRSVTVICEDSGLGDCLSTALFVLPIDQGQKLLETLGAEAMWMDQEGNLIYSDHFGQ